MTALDASIQIRSLRAQLEVLQARLRTVPEPPEYTLADLRGILEGQTQTTDEDIDAVKYQARR